MYFLSKFLWNEFSKRKSAFAWEFVQQMGRKKNSNRKKSFDLTGFKENLCSLKKSLKIDIRL